MENINDLVNKKRGLTISYRKNGTKTINSILDFSSRTVSKIIQRMLNDDDLEFGCSYCGWDDTIGDIHHINGKNIENCDNISNLCYLCPNCHRKVHKNLISKNDLKSFKEQIGDKWKKYSLTYRVKSEINYKKEIAEINKKIKILKEKEILDNLKKSNINFQKYGWVKDASYIIGITPQKVGKWLKRVDLDFYNKCYKRVYIP